MSQLIFLGFRDRHRASAVLNDLKRRDFDWVTDLDHAVVVDLETGKAKVQLNGGLSIRETAAWTSLWESLLNATLFLPATTNMAAVAARISTAKRSNGDSPGTCEAVTCGRWWKRDVGVDELFLRDVGAVLQEGGSAMFMLLHTSESGSVRRELHNYGSMLLHTMLSPEQDQKIGELFTLNLR